MSGSNPNSGITRRDRALILGGADNLWSDLRQIGTWHGIIIATNDAGWAYPHRIEHWASLHPKKFTIWESKRPKPHDYTTWAHYEWKGVDCVVDHWKGSSTGFGVRVAYELDCTRVVLAGAPMDPLPHFLGGDPWEACFGFREEWTDQLLPKLGGWAGNIRSLSGWTRDLHGYPTSDWLYGG